MMAVILLAHGSRDAQWREPVDAVASAIRQAQPDQPVSVAFLELAQPDLLAAARALRADHPGITRIRIFPLFFGLGRHAREDIPLLVTELRVRLPEVEVEVLPAAGEHAEVIDLLAKIAAN